jgi:hypothetical protein
LKQFVDINWKRPLVRHLKCIEISSLTIENVDKLKLLVLKSIELCNNNTITNELQALDIITNNEIFILK